MHVSFANILIVLNGGKRGEIKSHYGVLCEGCAIPGMVLLFTSAKPMIEFHLET